MRAIIYLDDEIVAVQGKAAAEAANMKVQSELQNLASLKILKNVAGSQFNPYFGLDLVDKVCMVEVPKSKIDAIHGQLKDAVTTKVLPAM